MDTETPMIWTKNGNVPIAGLTRVPVWDVQKTYIKFCERWLDASGEVVKESADVYLVPPSL
jgi:hypothetical protein